MTFTRTFDSISGKFLRIIFPDLLLSRKLRLETRHVRTRILILTLGTKQGTKNPDGFKFMAQFYPLIVLGTNQDLEF